LKIGRHDEVLTKGLVEMERVRSCRCVGKSKRRREGGRAERQQGKGRGSGFASRERLDPSTQIRMERDQKVRGSPLSARVVVRKLGRKRLKKVLQRVQGVALNGDLLLLARLGFFESHGKKIAREEGGEGRGVWRL